MHARDVALHFGSMETIMAVAEEGLWAANDVGLVVIAFDSAALRGTAQSGCDYDDLAAAEMWLQSP